VNASSADVVVVGAGLAGLAVAASLHEHGVDVRSFEARQRVGGRLLSSAPHGERRLDLGATWFWPNERRVRSLVAELGVGVFSEHPIGDALYQAGGSVQRLDGNPLDAASFRFSDGADSLAHALADRLPDGTVTCGAAVQRVEQSPGYLTVAAGGLSVQAAHVVIAVPPALAVSVIEFVPGLPEPLAGVAAATPVWMGTTTKVVVRYPTRFWRDQGLAGSAISHVGPIRELHDISGPDGDPPALFGFVTGPLDSPTVRADDVIAQLVEIFGADAANATDVAIQDWRSEAWTSPPATARLDDYRTYGHAVYQQPSLGGRLHWSSTETAIDAPGHIEGALAAAERTVETILGVDRPNT
jgi:monoamine oxidase